MVEGEPSSITPPSYEQLQEQLRQARESLQENQTRFREYQETYPATQTAATASMLTLSKFLRKPTPFQGLPKDRENRAVHLFLSSLENFLEHGSLEDKDQLSALISHLEGDAAKDFNAHVGDVGPFTTYKDAKEWLIAHYSPADPVNTCRDKFFACRQREDETFEQYQYRFQSLKNELDEPLSNSYVVYFFVKNLQFVFKKQIQGDPKYSTYKDITVEDVVAHLKRTNRGVNQLQLIRNSSSGQPENSRKRRKLDTSTPSNKPPSSNTSPGSNSTSSSTSLNDLQLTPKQNKFLDVNIARGGGRVLHDVVMNNKGWRERAEKEGLCYRCCAKDHGWKKCNAGKPLNPSSQS